MRGCDIIISAYNAVTTPVTATVINVIMLIILLILIWRYSSTYNAGVIIQYNIYNVITINTAATISIIINIYIVMMFYSSSVFIIRYDNIYNTIITNTIIFNTIYKDIYK